MTVTTKYAGLTVASKPAITELADKLYTLLIEHGNVNEAGCALALAETMWNGMPFQSIEQRAQYSMGLTPDIIADWKSRQ